MKRIYQIGNILALGFALVMNYLVGAQLLNVPSIGEISDRYATLLTPATYAFSIWSLIYVLLIGFVVYQARDVLKPNPDNDLPEKVGPFFIISSIMNGLWTYIFVSEQVALSVVVLAALVLSQFVVIRRLRIALGTPQIKTVLFVWWPLLIYTGWVIVALIVNAASWLQSMNIEVTPVGAVVTLAVLFAALMYLLIKRNVGELLLASAWGIGAIGVMQMQMSNGNELVAWAAIITALLLVAASALHGVRQITLGNKPLQA